VIVRAQSLLRELARACIASLVDQMLRPPLPTPGAGPQSEAPHVRLVSQGRSPGAPDG
jgi:hypothetical protein